MNTPLHLPPGTRLGAVHLTTRDAARLAAFYARLGFVPLAHHGARLTLGAGSVPLLHLHEDASAPLPPRRSPGLFHTAFLLPSKPALARLLVRLATAQVPLHGASDHATHLALYLADPDGNGIELAWDRPHADWPTTPQDLIARDGPLDFDDLLAAHDPATPLDASLDDGTVVGHVHLRVSDLHAARAFYQGALHFAESALFTGLPAYADSALFLAVGGYHHHLAVNMWASKGAPPLPRGAVGLRAFTLVLPEVAFRDMLAAYLYDRGYHIADATPDGALVHDADGLGVLLAAP